MMNSRLKWSQQEDRQLRRLKQEEKLTSWISISKKINALENGCTRTSKQCRDRYINFSRFSDQPVLETALTKEEVLKLRQLYIHYGSKWSHIRLHFPHRSENCLKNKFNSLLRKALRKLNSSRIFFSEKKKVRPIKASHLTKLLELRHKQYPVLQQKQQILNSIEKLLDLIFKEEQNISIEEVLQIYTSIIQLGSRKRLNMHSLAKMSNGDENQNQQSYEEGQSKMNLPQMNSKIQYEQKNIEIKSHLQEEINQNIFSELIKPFIQPTNSIQENAQNCVQSFHSSGQYSFSEVQRQLSEQICEIANQKYITQKFDFFQ